MSNIELFDKGVLSNFVFCESRNFRNCFRLRDSHPAFDKVKKQGAVGIPCFLLEDGAITFRPEDVGLRSDVESIGAVCNLDGSGC